MNSLSKIVAAPMVAGVLLVQVMAQSPQPLVAHPRPGLAWTVESLPASTRMLDSPERKKAPSPAEPGRKFASYRVGNGFIEQTRISPDGYTETTLVVGGVLLSKNPDGSFSITAPGEEGPGISASRIEGFDWVAERWFVGTAKIEGAECRIYRAPWPTPAEGEAAATEGGPSIAAAIGVADRLPRRLEAPFSIERYIFQTLEPPPVPPSAALEALRENEERGRALIRRYRIAQ